MSAKLDIFEAIDGIGRDVTLKGQNLSAPSGKRARVGVKAAHIVFAEGLRRLVWTPTRRGGGRGELIDQSSASFEVVKAAWRLDR